MIIDAHHHFPYQISEEGMKWIANLVKDVAGRMGQAIDLNAFIKNARATWEDPTG